MKHFSTLRSWLVGSVLALAAGTAMAVPARPGLITVTQPDGSQLQVRLVGDENGHYYLSEDGYLLVNADETFYYGELDADGVPVATQYVAAAPGSRTPADKAYLARAKRASESVQRPPIGRYPGSHFPCLGEQRAIVILVEYKDVKFNTEDPADYFSRMLNEEASPISVAPAAHAISSSKIPTDSSVRNSISTAPYA